MRGSIFIVAAIAAAEISSVYAGPHHVSSNIHKEVVERSDRISSCPNGFERHGDQCIHLIRTPPTIHCPFGFVRTVENEDACTRFIEKKFECPGDFIREQGFCVRTHQIEALVECPHGFAITSDGRQCSRHVPRPKRFFCPQGSVQRGDACFRKVLVEAKLICPHGFTFTEDHRCRIVETFDCTPELRANEEDGHHKHLRLLGERNKKHSLNEEIIPIEREFVVQRTCRRVRIEGPRRVCPEGSGHRNKECFVEEEGPLQERHDGFTEEIVNAKFLCPEGTTPSASIGRFQCLRREAIPASGFCPEHSDSVDNKCAIFRPLLARCPPDHILQNEHCVKAIVAPPIHEFNVKLRCIGKDCDSQTVSSLHNN